VRVLRQRRLGRKFVEELLAQELASAALSPVDRALCQELVYGVVRWGLTLDWLIARKTARPPRSLHLQLLLQLGLYQLFWLERIPSHAAVHETVELGKELGFAARAGFLNAVLRGYTRERDATRAALEELKRTQPALGYSHPQWLVDRWQKAWGREETTALLEWNNLPPPTCARLNSLKTDAAGLSKAWQEEAVRFRPRQWDWTGPGLVFELESHPPLTTLSSFQQGFFYLQDPSTLLAVQALAPEPGETILDLCAAPGGKTTFIAQLMRNQGRIVAQDNQAARLKLVQENCARLGVSCVETSLAPPVIVPGSAPRYDRILLDAPCSNTGVLRRRLELRWRLRPEEIQRLRLLQLELLRRAAPQLRPGGLLIYSTCSLEPEENAQAVKSFLDEHPDFTLETERLLLPFRDQVDGAYVARMRRK